MRDNAAKHQDEEEQQLLESQKVEEYSVLPPAPAATGDKRRYGVHLEGGEEAFTATTNATEMGVSFATMETMEIASGSTGEIANDEDLAIIVDYLLKIVEYDFLSNIIIRALPFSDVIVRWVESRFCLGQTDSYTSKVRFVEVAVFASLVMFAVYLSATGMPSS